MVLVSLNTEVSRLESKLEALSSRLQTLTRSAERATQHDQDEIQARLHSSIEAIKTTVLTLKMTAEEQRDDGPRINGVDWDAWDAGDAVEDLAQKIQDRFNDLESAASGGLERVNEVARQGHDLDSELNELSVEIRSLERRGQSELEVSQTDLRNKQEDQNTAQQRLNESNAEIRRLDAKISDNHENRQILRVGRVLAWGATLVFPPAAVVAAGMEIGAHEIRKKARNLEATKDAQDVRCTSLRAEILQLETKIKTIRAGLNTTRSLSGKCKELSDQTRKTIRKADALIRKYQEMKSSSDDFSGWTKRFKDRAAMIQDVADDSDEVKRVTNLLVEDILEVQNANAFKKTLGFDERGTKLLLDSFEKSSVSMSIDEIWTPLVPAKVWR